MIMLLGVGIMTVFFVFYLCKKSWHMLHKAVGITPGVLTCQDVNAPLSLPDITWQTLALNTKHLHTLSDEQLRQLQHIDKKVVIYHSNQQQLHVKNLTPVLTEQQFVLHKLLHTRLPEILAKHHYLLNSNNKDIRNADDTSLTEANGLLQEALDNIERRLDKLLEQLQTQHLEDLRVMKRYLDSQED